MEATLENADLDETISQHEDEQADNPKPERASNKLSAAE